MPLIRAQKISEVATAAQEWLDGSYDVEQAVSVGHVIVVVELRQRSKDESVPGERTGVGAWMAVYSDDARAWVRSAILREALTTVDGAHFFETEEEAENE